MKAIVVAGIFLALIGAGACARTTAPASADLEARRNGGMAGSGYNTAPPADTTGRAGGGLLGSGY